MSHFYPLLLSAGLMGGASLLAIALIPRLHPMRKLAAAFWITILTALWAGLPTEGRWVLSIWSPTTMLGGQILLDMTLPVWWCGLAMGLTLSGVTWIEVASSDAAPPLSGPLVLSGLLVGWLALCSGSLLTTLASWAIFDMLWGVSGLVVGGKGERVTLGLALHGVASVILWTVFLLLERGGTSVLWWLMRPTQPMLTLLMVAALMRIGFYPFQIVFPGRIEIASSLTLIYLMGAVPGVALLYRLLALPIEIMPFWGVLWGVLSVLWGGLMAWSLRGRVATLWGAYGLLGIITAGAMIGGMPAMLMQSLAVWLAAAALILLTYGRDTRAVIWSWPAWLALFYMLGVPPSPIGVSFWALMEGILWGWRIVMALGGVMISAAFMRGISQPARATVTPPWPWQRACLAIGFALVVLALFIVPQARGGWYFSWLGLGLWFLVMLGAVALARWGLHSRYWLQRGAPILELLDLQWFYRALWRGAEHLLSVMRFSAEVVEGSGALMWSFLVLMLVLFVVMNQ